MMFDKLPLEFTRIAVFTPKPVIAELILGAVKDYKRTNDDSGLMSACILMLCRDHLERCDNNVEEALKKIEQKLHVMSLFENKEN